MIRKETLQKVRERHPETGNVFDNTALREVIGNPRIIMAVESGDEKGKITLSEWTVDDMYFTKDAVVLIMDPNAKAKFERI